MSIDQFVEQIFPVECRGRNPLGREVLAQPVEVKVRVYKSPGCNSITSAVDCPYNTGGHGQRCRASHPGVEKLGEGVFCAYIFAVPEPPQ